MRTRASSVAAAALAVLIAGDAAGAVPVTESRGVLREEAVGRSRDEVRDSEQAPAATRPGPVVSGDESPAARDVASRREAGVGALVHEQQLMRQELQELRGTLEELGYRLTRLERENQQRYLDLDRRLQSGSATPQPVVGSEPAPETPAVSGDPEGGAYAAAFELVRGRQYASAIDAFSSFLAAYASGRYAVNAHYWLGESYLALPVPELERARQSFVQVVELFPGNPKIADALYKLGTVHDRMGDIVKAREYLERVRSEHPDSTAAGLAEKHLAQL